MRAALIMIGLAVTFGLAHLARIAGLADWWQWALVFAGTAATLLMLDRR